MYAINGASIITPFATFLAGDSFLFSFFLFAFFSSSFSLLRLSISSSFFSYYSIRFLPFSRFFCFHSFLFAVYFSLLLVPRLAISSSSFSRMQRYVFSLLVSWGLISLQCFYFYLSIYLVGFFSLSHSLLPSHCLCLSSFPFLLISLLAGFSFSLPFMICFVFFILSSYLVCVFSSSFLSYCIILIIFPIFYSLVFAFRFSFFPFHLLAFTPSFCLPLSSASFLLS